MITWCGFKKNDITQWFKFFLVGVIETAKSSISTFDRILKLQKDIERRTQQWGSRANNANIIIKHLYQDPILDAQKTKKLTGLSAPSAYKLIDDLKNQGMIYEMTGSKRGKIFYFWEYVDIFSSKDD